MKIILNESDLKIIDIYDKDIKERRNDVLYVNNYNRKYMFDFKVTDLAKANSFIHAIMGHSRLETIKEIEEKLGIEITAIRYDTNAEDVKNILREALERLENM